MYWQKLPISTSIKILAAALIALTAISPNQTWAAELSPPSDLSIRNLEEPAKIDKARAVEAHRPSVVSAIESAINQDIDADTARTQILAGVAKLANPTQPGKMVVFGDTAYSIANYKDQNRSEPMIAAAGWGLGKVLAMGDHQWLNMDNYGDIDDTGTLYLNSMAWLAGTTDKTIKIVVTQNTAAKGWLEARALPM